MSEERHAFVRPGWGASEAWECLFCGERVGALTVVKARERCAAFSAVVDRLSEVVAKALAEQEES